VPKVLTALGLESEPAGHLAELASALHAAYVRGDGVIRMLSRDGKPTGLGDAFAQ
jgi:hypothetical protein